MLKDNSLFFLGDWQVNPSTNTLRRGELIKQIEPKAMDVLLLLCAQKGQVLSADDIATQCWGGMDIGDNPVHKAITQLRKALDDKPSTPTYIETIRKRGYHIIAKLDFPLDDELKAEQSNWEGASPFPGLVAFEAKDAQVFFGRKTQISTLLERLSNQVSAQHTFCLILGPSGTGKSSLVNAGLLPALTGPNGYNGMGVVSHTSIDFADISHERLFIDLASALLDWDVNDQPVFAGLSAEKLAEQLQEDTNTSIEQCIEALKQIQQSYSKPQFLLFIDRLEVLLSSPVFNDAERTAFLDLIEKLSTSGAIIVISACRNDFYPLVVNHPSLMANKGNGGHFDLLAPTRIELMQMIRLPAIAANLTWSVDDESATPLDQILCAEAANNPDALPMLQYTLQELYLQRNETDELQVSVYKSLGGIEGAIGKKAEEIYQQLPKEHQPQLAAVLSRLVTLSPDGETITSRAARWSELSHASETSFVQAMVNSRLFVSHLQNDEPCFSLAHEALLRRWLRASEWISAHKDSLMIKSRLQQLTDRWLNEDKSSAYLLPQGKPLEEALSLQNMPVFALDKNELALLKASQQRVKTKRWLTRSTIALLCLLTFTAIIMSVKSQQAEAFAQQKRLDAESLLGFMVGEFADKLRSVKRMDLLDGISNKALEYFSNNTNESLSFEASFQHARTLAAIGEVAQSRNKIDEARQAFGQANVVTKELLEQFPNNIELLTLEGANAFWLGQIAYDLKQWQKARLHMKEYLASSNLFFKIDPTSTDALREVFYAHSSLGALDVSERNYAAALERFQQALRLSEQLLTLSSEDTQTLADHGDTLSWLRRISLALGDVSQAKRYMQEIIEILDQPAILNTKNVQGRVDLAVALHNYANILIAENRAVDALPLAQRAYELLTIISREDPDNTSLQLDKDKHLNLLISLQAREGVEIDRNLKNILNTLPSLPKSSPDQKEVYIKRLWEFIGLYDRTGEKNKVKSLVMELKQEFNKLNTEDEELLSIHAKLKLMEYRFNWDINGCNKANDLLVEIATSNLSPTIQQPYQQALACLASQGKYK